MALDPKRIDTRLLGRTVPAHCKVVCGGPPWFVKDALEFLSQRYDMFRFTVGVDQENTYIICVDKPLDTSIPPESLDPVSGFGPLLAKELERLMAVLRERYPGPAQFDNDGRRVARTGLDDPALKPLLDELLATGLATRTPGGVLLTGAGKNALKKGTRLWALMEGLGLIQPDDTEEA